MAYGGVNKLKTFEKLIVFDPQNEMLVKTSTRDSEMSK